MSLPIFAILFLIMSILVLFYLLLLFVSFIFFEVVPSKEKTTAFECGFSSFSDAYGPFNIQYYFTALYFLVFDLELALFLPTIPLLLHLGYFASNSFLGFSSMLFLCIFFERLNFFFTKSKTKAL